MCSGLCSRAAFSVGVGARAAADLAHHDHKYVGYVDVHCHLTHDVFLGKEEEVVTRAKAAGLSRIIVNGIDPRSNRDVLRVCVQHEVLRAALGIYPLHACLPEMGQDARAHAQPFDIAAELAFIEAQAAAGELVAIGEVGLDGLYGHTERLLGAQEAVLRELCRIGKRYSLPLIVHSRKAELRTLEVLQSEGVELADFHCFTGSKTLAKQVAAQYYLSIPANVTRSHQFQSFCRVVPPERILTETDAPFLSPTRGVWPNEPCTVPAAVPVIARELGVSVEEAIHLIRRNYTTLFGD